MADPVTRLSGTFAGRYRIERLLGEGGTSVVYLADDVRLERKVAVKVLKADLAAAVGPDRFLAEIKTTALLQHPHILPLFDSGEAEGFLFYVMAYFGGATLRERLDQAGPLPIGDALDIANGVGKAITYAHRKRVLHRDIKPENILLAADGPMVMDFGIALMLGDAASGRITDSGVAIGTRQYMSPEQASGETELDGRSDLYSLACVLYEMLAGKPPYSPSSHFAVMARSRIGSSPVKSLRKDVPQHVDDALQRALEGDPEKRFASVADFVAALNERLPVGIAAARDGPRATTAAVGSPERRLGILVLPIANISEDRTRDYVCTGLAMEIIYNLERVNGLTVIAPDSALTLPQPTTGVGRLLETFGVTHALEGYARFVADDYRVDVVLSEGDGRRRPCGRFEGTLVTADTFHLQDEIARAILRVLPERLHLPSEPRRRPDPGTYDLYLEARGAWFRRDVPGLFEAIELFKRAIELDDQYARAHAGLADVYNVLGGVDYATHHPREIYPAACRAADRALEIDPELAEAHAAKGNYLMSYAWEWDAARRHLERALQLKPSYSIGRQWYSNYLQYVGRGDEALSHAQQALVDDPRSAFLRSSLARHYMFMRQPEKAAENFRLAIELDPAFHGARVGHALSNLLSGRPEDCLREVEAMSEASSVDRKRQAPLLLAVHGYALAGLGDEEGARGKLAALRATRGIYVPHELVALVHVGLGEHVQALNALYRAFSARSQAMSQLKAEPLLDPLRGEPRFQELLKGVGLAGGQGRGPQSLTR